ncbi:MAG: hypothetical protein JRN35_06045 [Nitrososphaerota archaeon]|nr:hypothetical protein [Nitrososphaerota archaeon]
MDKQQRIHEENMGNPDAVMPEAPPPPVPEQAAPEPTPPPEEPAGDETDAAGDVPVEGEEAPPEGAVPPEEAVPVPKNRFRLPVLPSSRRLLERVGEYASTPAVTNPMEASRPGDNSIKDLVDVTPEDNNFLTGTDDEMIDIGEHDHPEDVADMTAKDKDYLFGSDVSRVTGLKPRRKVRYQPTSGKRRTRRTNGQFLSRTGE